MTFNAAVLATLARSPFRAICPAHAVARDPELLTFLTMWNYEEFFHSQMIIRLMKECGVELESPQDRTTNVRKNARLKAKVEDFAQTMMAKLVP